MRRQAPPAFAALVLVGLGLFLYSRWSGGSLNFYIADRFAPLILAAAAGLVLVGLVLARRPGTLAAAAGSDQAHPHEGGPDRAQGHGHDHDHSHGQGRHGWLGLLLVAAPMILGLALPPRPLGASAMAGRELRLDGAGLSSSTVAFERRLRSPQAGRNILDWLYSFQLAADKSSLEGEAVDVVGFVYRDEQRLGGGSEQPGFFVSRFTLSCCVADASPVSLLVRHADADSLASDAWVRVKGRLKVETLGGRQLPVVEAEDIQPVPVPAQPYLYP